MKQKILISILFCFLFMLTGCWNRKELNDIAITVALGIDQSEDQYSISAQIVNPSEIAAKVAGGKGAPVVTYTARGDTVFEALRKMTKKAPRKIYLSHLRLIVLGEDFANEVGIGKALDFLSRDHEIRTDFALLVAKGVSAEKVLQVYTIPQEIIPSNKIFKSLETSEKAWAATAIVTLDEVISDIVSEGKQPAITGIELTGEKEKEEVQTKKNVDKISPISSPQIADVAIFKKDKLVGWLNEEESKGFQYIMGNVKSTVGHVSCPDGGKVALEIIRTKSEITGNVINGKPIANVKIRIEANVGDVECDIDLSKTENIYKLDKLAEEKVKGKMEDAVKKAKEYRTDIFGFGEAIRRSNPKAWKEMKDDWDEKFADLQVNIKVDHKLRSLGTITKSFQDKLKE